MGEKPLWTIGECAVREKFLNCWSKFPWCVPRHAAENRLALVSKVWADQRQQLENDLLGNLVRNRRSRSTAEPVMDAKGSHSRPWQARASIFDSSRCALFACCCLGLQLLRETPVRLVIRLDETCTKQDPKRLAHGSIRDDMCLQPISQQSFRVLAGAPWGVVFEQQRDDGLHGDEINDAVAVAEPLIDQASELAQASVVIGA